LQLYQGSEKLGFLKAQPGGLGDFIRFWISLGFFSYEQQ